MHEFLQVENLKSVYYCIIVAKVFCLGTKSFITIILHFQMIYEIPAFTFSFMVHNIITFNNVVLCSKLKKKLFDG